MRNSSYAFGRTRLVRVPVLYFFSAFLYFIHFSPRSCTLLIVRLRRDQLPVLSPQAAFAMRAALSLLRALPATAAVAAASNAAALALHCEGSGTEQAAHGPYPHTHRSAYAFLIASCGSGGVSGTLRGCGLTYPSPLLGGSLGSLVSFSTNLSSNSCALALISLLISIF